MDYELYHYGVKGMKLGVRRAKYDNKIAFAKGKKATELAYATRKAIKKSSKATNKANEALAKDPFKMRGSTLHKIEKSKIEKATLNSLKKRYGNAVRDAEKHCNELISKYGKENVKTLHYKNTKDGKFLKEKVNDPKIVGARIAVSTLINFSPLPIIYIPLFRSGKDNGNIEYAATRRYEKHKNKSK